MLNKIVVSTIAVFSVFSLLAVTLSLPAFVSAALPPPSTQTETNEYKCNPAKATSTGVEENDGKRTIETINVLRNGKVRVSCRPAPLGTDGYVAYCGQDGECKTFQKATPAASNLMSIYGQAASLGDADKLGVSLPAQTLVEAMYDPDQLTRLQDNVIGHEWNSYSNFDYARVFDATVVAATFEESSASLEDAKNATVAGLEEIAAGNDAKAAPLPPRGLPTVWPNWMGVASELDPARMTDDLDMGPPWKSVEGPDQKLSGSSEQDPKSSGAFTEPQSTFSSAPFAMGPISGEPEQGSAPQGGVPPLTEPQYLSPFARYPFVPDIQETEARLWELEAQTTHTVETLWQEVSVKFALLYSSLHDWLFPPVTLEAK